MSETESDLGNGRNGHSRILHLCRVARFPGASEKCRTPTLRHHLLVVARRDQIVVWSDDEPGR